MPEAITFVPDRASELAAAIHESLFANRTDEAERLVGELAALTGRPADDPCVLTLTVMIDIQRGRALDALQRLSCLGDDRCPQLRAMCLNALGDPVWHGVATGVAETSPDPAVRRAMRQLLGTEQAA